MKTPTILSLVLTLSYLVPTAALAQEPAATPARTRDWRIDIVASGGAGMATDVPDDDVVGSIRGQLTVAHRSGSGFRVGLDHSFSSIGLGAHPARSSTVFDAGYVHRFHLLGDDRLGLAVDAEGGVAIGSVDDFGTSSFGGGYTEPDPGRVADGAHLGASAGLSLDARLVHFVIGLEARGRVMGALERTSEQQSPMQADLILGLHLGTSF